MPEYQITTPDGGVFKVSSPTELTDEQAYQYATQQAAQSKPDKFEGQGFTANLKNEVRGGLRQAFNPSQSDFIGSEYISDLPVVGNTLRNLANSILGGTRALYSVPNTIAKTVIGDPMREAGYDTAANIAEGGAGLALSLLGGGIPYIGKAANLLNKGAKVPSVLEGGLAASSKLPVRMIGKALDPLASSSPRLLEKTKTAMVNRANTIDGLQRQITTAQEGIAPLTESLKTAQTGVSTIEKQMNELRLASLENTESKLAQTARIPKAPEAPNIPAIPGATNVGDVGEVFKESVLPGAREALYNESRIRYDALREVADKLPVAPDDIDRVMATVEKLGGESRLPRTTGAVGEQLQLERAGGAVPIAALGETPGHLQLSQAAQSFRDLDPALVESLAAKGLSGNEIMKMVQQGLVSQGGATVGNAMRADHILSAAARGFQKSGDLAARSAVKELQAPIRAILEKSPIAADLETANWLHRGISDIVGSRSLSEKVFKVKPEQVVDNIFLPGGRGNPNISLINDARQIYQRVAPGEWPKLTSTALAKLQERVIGPTGAIEPNKFLGEWRKYRSTFEAALEPDAFKAVDSIAEQVRGFNRSRGLYERQLRQVRTESGAIKDFYARKSAELELQKGRLGLERAGAKESVKQIEDQIHEANKLVDNLHEQLKRTETFGMQGHAKGADVIMAAAMSPHMMIAIAQLGQALQATFTGNWAGAGRQLMQGLVWATMGNPLWLEKLAQNPQLAKAVSVALTAQKGARISIDSARLLMAATKAIGDEISSGANEGQ